MKYRELVGPLALVTACIAEAETNRQQQLHSVATSLWFESATCMALSRSEGSICGERVSLEDEESYSEGIDFTEGSAPNSKCARQSQNEGGFLSRVTKMDEGGWISLDEPLREKIIARLPFKSLFQAASLSKAWRLKFRCGSFQSEVHGSTAASWKAYAPLYVNHKKDLVGYESSSERWHILPNHSYLQRDLVEDWCLRAGTGSLLCWTSAAPFTVGNPNSMHYRKVYHVHVTNPLTRSWRQLPNRSQMQFPDLVHVGCEGTEAYKVMLATVWPNICVQIFDSTTGSWTMDDTEGAFDTGGSALIDGVLYMLVITMMVDSSGYQLVSFDVKKRIWKEIPHQCKVIDGDRNSHHHVTFHDVRFSQVFVCGSNVMQVVAHMEYGSDDERTVLDIISVFKLDLERGLAVEVSRAPNDMANMASVCSAAGHGDCIYIGGRFPSCSSVLYNVVTQEWHWVSSATDRLKTSFSNTHMNQWLWTSITYQPGLNPFLEV